MHDYSFLGENIMTPCGVGRFLEYENGKVLVVMDYETPPVEFKASDVYLI